MTDIDPQAKLNVYEVGGPENLAVAKQRTNLVWNLMKAAGKAAGGAFLGFGIQQTGRVFHVEISPVLAPIAGGVLGYVVPAIVNGFSRRVRLSTAQNPDGRLFVGAQEITE